MRRGLNVMSRHSARSTAPRGGGPRLLSWLACGLALLGLSAIAQEADDPTAGPSKYLGVVTCSGSSCHGAPRAGDARVIQNEFLIWHRDDQHAKAYRVLLEDEGQRIARNLGIKNAASAPECLACHATNAAAELRGKRFQIADGVGCEACHGPASKWLGLHVTGAASREENLKAGMYRTEEPAARAALCLSCHLGNENKFTTHRIMGAGHPRLSFELDTFTMLQPAHYRVDADYRERKQLASHAQVWAVGQATAAARALELFMSERWQGKGLMPEFAFFDCHACHHPMDAPRWAPRVTTGLPPGVVRLNDANLLMLLYLTKALEPALADDLQRGLLALHQASAESPAATQTAAKALKGTVDRAAQRVRGGIKPEQTAAVLAGIVDGGVAGDYQDYAAAEQAVMAIHALTDALRDNGTLDTGRMTAVDDRIKVLYTVLENQNAYEPARFRSALSTLQTVLN
jgi:hypothetical protein